MLDESAKLLGCKRARFALALGRTFDVNEIYGVDLERNQLPPHRPVEQNVHHTANVAFALRGKAEALNPLLNRQRLDLNERNICPMRPDVMSDPGLIPALSHKSLGNRFSHV